MNDAIRRIGFATLVTPGLEANHLPMLLSEDGTHLRGHVARANPVWKKGDGEALAIFLGPHCLCHAQLVSQQGGNRKSRADLELHHGSCAR